MTDSKSQIGASQLEVHLNLQGPSLLFLHAAYFVEFKCIIHILKTSTIHSTHTHKKNITNKQTFIITFMGQPIY